MVTAPVAAEIAILLPATNEVTPIFVTVIDPELVIGEPETEIPVPAVIPTEVTDPGPTAVNERFPPPSETNASPDPPSVVGKVYAVPPDPKVKLLVTCAVPVNNEVPKTSRCHFLSIIDNIKRNVIRFFHSLVISEDKLAE